MVDAIEFELIMRAGPVGLCKTICIVTFETDEDQCM
jgi:hypothetical protein